MLSLPKVLDLFNALDAETVKLFMQFIDDAKEAPEGINEHVKKCLRRVVVIKTVKASRV